MKMRRNCNLELRLFPYQDSSHDHHHPMVGEGSNNSSKREMSAAEDEGQQQKLTIFYDGKVCVSDVTHLQARWIMKEASKEMAEEEENMMKLNRSLSQSQRQMYSPNSNNASSLSMKRSLQRFLQKRKDRILHSPHPYHHHP
ncbi:hypothetical protein QN277_009914 [Acacia crassicarpa]|uniref:Protein TIFY n=2 Tax=Acacia crassicarpa TaxID=499986 RepID=A0AAE1M6C7_9FABA|nr:hypothetical protein QN277_009914 [Acacia crassicarpa]